MRSHEACCFSMIRSKVADALLAMVCPPVDFVMSCCAPAVSNVSYVRLVNECLSGHSTEGGEEELEEERRRNNNPQKRDTSSRPDTRHTHTSTAVGKCKYNQESERGHARVPRALGTGRLHMPTAMVWILTELPAQRTVAQVRHWGSLGQVTQIFTSRSGARVGHLLPYRVIFYPWRCRRARGVSSTSGRWGAFGSAAAASRRSC